MTLKSIQNHMGFLQLDICIGTPRQIIDQACKGTSYGEENE